MFRRKNWKLLKRKPYYKADSKDYHKPFQKSSDAILSTPEPDKLKEVSFADKYESLHAMRRAKGLCFKCGDKFSPGHKCADKISLHVLDELLDTLQLPGTSASTPLTASDSESDTDLMSISEDAIQGTSKRKTIKLQGLVGKQSVLVLIDSGSSHNYISDQLVLALNLVTSPVQATSVHLADGKPMQSNKIVNNLMWWTQGHTFTTSMRVLSLGCYDIILGMDWLSDCSPMFVNWKTKKLRFTHQGKRITLRGLKNTVSTCVSITATNLNKMITKGQVEQVVHLCPITSEQQTPDDADIPTEVQALLTQHVTLFAEPASLPPSRPYDHTIPLLSGAQPVNIRPYRISPQLKDELETQVHEMLTKGFIQTSTSPFSSPVLLVKKKEGTWRFCVDYRQVNAITVKNKCPMPVVEELLDELAGSQWFTKLDLRTGYHQIRMAPGGESKTAFKTHNGHSEFRVMPFGLTSAPATFQAVMNTIFQPILRKFVLVFVDDILIYSRTLQDHLIHLQQVFDILQKTNFFVKYSKCSFAQQQLEYLGHINGIHGVATDNKKIEAVCTWPVPTNVKQVRAFLGLAGYYR